MYNNNKKFECRLFVKEFSISDNPYFIERDYVCVSSVDDEEKMEKLIESFFIHNQSVYCSKDAIIMPKVTYWNVFKPTIDDIVEFNKLQDGRAEWNRCDDDQWVKYLGNHEYEFYSIVQDDEGDFRVYNGAVKTENYMSLGFKNDYNYEDIVEIIQSYGYGSLLDSSMDYKDRLIALVSEMSGIYGDSYEQIIAEMLFETYHQNFCDAAFEYYGDALNYVMDNLK